MEGDDLASVTVCPWLANKCIQLPPFQHHIAAVLARENGASQEKAGFFAQSKDRLSDLQVCFLAVPRFPNPCLAVSG